MNRLLLCLLMLPLVACGRKKPSGTSTDDTSLVKLFIAPRTALADAARDKDLTLLLRRFAAATSYTDLKLERTPSLHLVLRVHNNDDKRLFLKTITPLLKYTGRFALHSVLPWPATALEAKRPTPIHLVTLDGLQLFRSVERDLLLNFVAPLGMPFHLRRIPKGTYDFPKSYWVAYRTGPALQTIPSLPGTVAATRGTTASTKWVAVLLDSYIVQLVPTPGPFTPKDPTGRINPAQMRALLTNGPLAAPWRISRIEATQKL